MNEEAAIQLILWKLCKLNQNNHNNLDPNLPLRMLCPKSFWNIQQVAVFVGQLFLLFYGKTPQYSYISYLGWYAGYLFLLFMLLEVRGPRPALPRSRLLWAFPLFTVGMCLFYLQWGDWIGNITAAVLMTLLLWHATDCLLLWRRSPADAGRRFLAFTILGFCAVEDGAWTSSCFWMGDTLLNPYFWFDSLLSVCYLLFPPALRKAVEA